MTIDSFTDHAHDDDSDRLDPALTPLSRAQAARLISLAMTTAARLGLDVAYHGGTVLVPVDTGPMLGLTNLARILAKYAEDDWPRVIDEHFTQLLQQLRDGPPTPPEDPERELIQRLVPRDALPDDWTADRPDFLPGLVSVPAAVNGDTVTMYLSPSDFGLTWSAAEQFGMTNLRRLTDHVEYAETDDIRLAFVTGTCFAASRALVLDTVLRESLGLESPPPHGVLAAVPTRDLLVIHVIEDLSVIPALGLLRNFAARSYAHDPGPLSPDVHLVTPTSGSATAGPRGAPAPFTWHPATTFFPDDSSTRLSPQLDSLIRLLATREPPPTPP